MYSDIQLEHGRDPSPEDLRTLTETNDQLLVIFRNAPNLLVNIIPLLEENLRAADETPLREISVKTLGSMFGERPLFGSGVVDIARAFPSAWRSWIGRHVDKALPVRLAWVEAAGPILVNHSELRKELERECLLFKQDLTQQPSFRTVSRTRTSACVLPSAGLSARSTTRLSFITSASHCSLPSACA
jgi:sister-chromatid-cohesion protein PDS5